VAELPDGLEEGHDLDVTHRAAHFDDDHVDLLGGEMADARLDLVGDVRDDLHGLSQVLAVALLTDHLGVDRPRGGVGRRLELDVDETLVVPEVEVGLTAVVGDEYLAVLERVHGARSTLMYGSSLIIVSRRPRHLRSRPSDEAVSPLPSDERHTAGDEDVLGQARSFPGIVPR